MSGLCTRLGEKILRDVHDVINDVTNDVIFHLKKLILKPFLHIKGRKYVLNTNPLYSIAFNDELGAGGRP